MTTAITSMLINGVQRYALCVEIEREDGIILRFTDHNKELVFEGETYSPVSGFILSARARTAGTTPANIGLTGAVSDTRVAEDDLFVGKFRNAKVTERVVDWLYPFGGAFRTDVYYIRETRHDREVWRAQLESLMARLAAKIGDYWSRNCRFTLGDSRCGVNLAALTVSASISTVVEARRKFTSTIASGNGDKWYNYGVVTWTSGNNNGLKSEVKRYTQAAGLFELQVAAPFVVQVGDTFTIHPGCNKLFDGDCFLKFDNRLRFGGFPYLPGNDKTFTTPDAEV